jgi:hypothetical protein
MINYSGGQDPTKAHTCAPLRRQTSMILSILNYKTVMAARITVCHGAYITLGGLSRTYTESFVCLIT